MILPTLKPIHNRKKTATDIKPSPVEICVTYRGKCRYFSTGLSVCLSQWDPSERQVVNHPDSYILNFKIQKQLDCLKENINLQVMRGEEISLTQLSNTARMRVSTDSFIKYVEEKIEERPNLRISTKKSQKRILYALERFKKIVTFADLTKTKIRAFDNWLMEQYTQQSTINALHRIMKTYVNIAITEGYIKENPYEGVKIKRGESAKITFLDTEELEAVKAINVESKGVMHARDLFLFQCFTGLSYVDMALYNFEKMEKKNGEYVIHKARQKTGVEYHVVLLPPAVEILERYAFRLPVMTNQKYNVLLKMVAAHAGITKNLTSHCGRHTFATWCLNNDVPMEVVKTMLGHSDSRTTEIYAKILDNRVDEAFKDLKSRLKTG